MRDSEDKGLLPNCGYMLSSIANMTIALVKVGCKLRSTLRNELARDKDVKLTSWETDRQCLFISMLFTPSD